MIGERPVLKHTNLGIDEEYETAQQVMEGMYLADVMQGGDIVRYTNVMEYYGDNASFVGFSHREWKWKHVDMLWFYSG